MFMAALFVMARNWNRPKCPSTDEWINRLRYIHTMQNGSVIKRNELLIHETIWMNLKGIMVSERNSPK